MGLNQSLVFKLLEPIWGLLRACPRPPRACLRPPRACPRPLRAYPRATLGVQKNGRTEFPLILQNLVSYQGRCQKKCWQVNLEAHLSFWRVDQCEQVLLSWATQSEKKTKKIVITALIPLWFSSFWRKFRIDHILTWLLWEMDNNAKMIWFKLVLAS